jgi:hypothetical protein
MAASIDEYSVAAIPLTLICRGNNLSTASGFFYRHDGEYYLVSNWHVLSGRHPNTGQALSNTGGTPDKVALPFHVAGQLGAWSNPVVFDLCDSNEDPLWVQHSRGQEIDVALLRISLPTGGIVYELPRPSETTDMVIGVAADVFVLGYPVGLSHQGIFPVWKRASIATEPQIPIGNLPTFLIDSATREGMSGSAVIARTNGIYRSTDGTNKVRAQASQFLGVYSGRYGADDELAAQLGRVWHRNAIEEILARPSKGGYRLITP